MDWQTILTSVLASLLSSGAIVAAIAYLLKRSFDRALDLRYEKLLEESKLRAKEGVRRESVIYDKQMQVFQEVLSLTYKLRNATRELAEQIEKKEGNDKRTRETMTDFNTNFKALRELLFKERAILPPFIFNLVHDLRNATGSLEFELASLQEQKSKASTEDMASLYRHAEKSYSYINHIYEMLVNAIQIEMGIVKEESNP